MIPVFQHDQLGTCIQSLNEHATSNRNTIDLYIHVCVTSIHCIT